MAGCSARETNSAGSSENGHDVDLLASQLGRDHAHPCASGADAGAHRVDVAVVGPDGDLRPVAGLARAGLDLDDAVGDLGHLELEEPLDEARVAARDDDLRTLGRLSDLDDVGLEPGAVVVALVGDLLGLGQQRLDLAEVEQRVAVVALLDDPGHDVALATGVLLVLAVALGLTDALQDHLARRLGGDAAEVVGSVVPLAGDVALFVQLLAVHADLAGVRVDRHDGLLGGLREALVGGDEGVGERVEQRVDRDPLLRRDLLERLQEVEIR